MTVKCNVLYIPDKKPIIFYVFATPCLFNRIQVIIVNQLVHVNAYLSFGFKVKNKTDMANILGFVGIGVTGVALLFAIIALAADKWQTSDVTVGAVTVETKVGLWEICTKSSGSESCTKIADASGKFTVTFSSFILEI